MKIKSSEFVKSAVSEKDFPRDGLPEIALIGRSNVGKSSLINTFINRKGLAKTSSTPGKTRTINFYLINNAFYLVDLPGHGYAKVPVSERRAWKLMIEDYIEGRPNLAGGIVILDIRRDPGEVESGLYGYFDELGLPLLTVLTKADKFSKNRRVKREAEIRRAIDIKSPVIFSATTGDGKDVLGARIYELLSAE